MMASPGRAAGEPSACHTLNAIESLMNCTLPSPSATFTPPGCVPRAVSVRLREFQTGKCLRAWGAVDANARSAANFVGRRAIGGIVVLIQHALGIEHPAEIQWIDGANFADEHRVRQPIGYLGGRQPTVQVECAHFIAAALRRFRCRFDHGPEAIVGRIVEMSKTCVPQPNGLL